MTNWLFPWSGKKVEEFEEIKDRLERVQQSLKKKVSQDYFISVNTEIQQQRDLQQEEILNLRTDLQAFTADYQIRLQELLTQAAIDPSQLTISKEWIEHFLLIGAKLQEYYIEVNRMATEFKLEKESLLVQNQRNFDLLRKELNAKIDDVKSDIADNRAEIVKLNATETASRKFLTLLFWFVAGSAGAITIIGFLGGITEVIKLVS